MRGFGLLLAAGAAGLMAGGCASQGGSAFDPRTSCVYVAEDGSFSSALVKEYGEEQVEEGDLEQYLEAAVIRFNEERGAGGASRNEAGEERLPAALAGVSVKDGVMKAVFDFRTAEDLLAFRQTDDNEDVSSTFTSLQAVKMEEAIRLGWFKEADTSAGEAMAVEGETAETDETTPTEDGTIPAAAGGTSNPVFLEADGSEASLADMQKEKKSTVIRAEGGGVIAVEGKILYRTAGTEQKNEYTVTAPEGSETFLVFK